MSTSTSASVKLALSSDSLTLLTDNYHPTATRGGYTNPPVISGGVYPPPSHSTASILYPFGHGLSYGAEFKYTGLALSASTVSTTGTVQVSFTVQNNGTAAAEEVVQMYVRDEVASVTTPVMQVRANRPP